MFDAKFELLVQAQDAQGDHLKPKATRKKHRDFFKSCPGRSETSSENLGLEPSDAVTAPPSRARYGSKQQVFTAMLPQLAEEKDGVLQDLDQAFAIVIHGHRVRAW